MSCCIYAYFDFHKCIGGMLCKGHIFIKLLIGSNFMSQIFIFEHANHIVKLVSILDIDKLLTFLPFKCS